MALPQVDEPMARFRALLGELGTHADMADSQDLQALALAATGHRSDAPLVVIDPIELVKEGPRPGDLLLRTARAQGVEYLGVIVGDYVGTADAFAARGIPVESAGPGLFVEVAEVPFEGGTVSFSARRISDYRRGSPRGQTICRPSQPAGSPGVDDDGEELFESEELARHAAFESTTIGEAGPTSSQPTILTSAQLREAWASYECAEDRMTRLRLFGRWYTPVNPETVDAWRVFERTLLSAGYQPHRAWVYNCRQIAGQQTRSLHAYGLAIDIDHSEPTCNVNRPTPDGRPVRFSTAATKDERCHDVRRGVADTSFTPEQIEAVEAIQTVEGRQVFAWGGRWRTTKDTMHFQINVTPTQLGRGIRLDAASGGPVPQPIAAFQNVPAAPDPQGIAALTQLLGNPNLFRDITGLTEDQRNALAGLQDALGTAQFFGGEAADLALQGIDQALDTINEQHETSLEAEAVRDFDKAPRSQRDDELTADTADEHEDGYWSAEAYETGAELDDGLTSELEFDEALEPLSEELLLFGEAEGEVGAAGESCKKNWFAEVEALPAEVRNAIAYVPTNGTLDLYLLAVRNGIRDERTLLRLMYYSWYGSQYGYCEPQSQPAKARWNEMAGALKAYRKWPQPPAVQTAPVLCSKQKPVKISPDAPTLDITGRYYTLDPPATYVINQAGQHIEGVGSLVLESSSKKRGDHRPVTLFQGDLREGTYHWFNRDKPSNYGRISERGGHFFISLGLRDDSIVWELMRPTEKRPTVVPAGDLDRPFNELERYELTPLTPVQMKFIRTILDKDKLDLIFDTYFNAQKRDTAMGGLYRRLVDTPDHASYVPRLEKFHDVDLPLLRLYARQVLTFHKWKSSRNVIRSHIDWIQMMMDRSMGPGGQAARDFKRYLGMTPEPQRASQDGEHTYEFTIQLTGASFLLAGYVGTVQVEKTSGRRWQKPKTFDVEFWGGNVSLTLFDAKIGSEFKGVGRSYLEWTENDIPGRVRLARASASVGMDVVGSHAGFMHVLGDGSLPTLDVFFWDAKLGVPNVNKILEESAKGKVEEVMKGEGGLSPKGVIGLDVGVSVLFGTISEPGSILDIIRRKSRGPQVIDLSRDLQTDVSVVRSLDTQVHFCLDDDQPTAAAIQALRIVCARELPLFMTPDSYLVVVGHADNLGSPQHNEDLSQRRAANTVKAIRNILGDKFRIKDDPPHIRIVGKGEEWAAKESPTKERPAPKHRRVQIYLNSVLVLTLFGQSTIAAAPASSQASP